MATNKPKAEHAVAEPKTDAVAPKDNEEQEAPEGQGTSPANANRTIITAKELAEAQIVFGLLKPIMDALAQKVDKGAVIETGTLDSNGDPIEPRELKRLGEFWKIFSKGMSSVLPLWPAEPADGEPEDNGEDTPNEE